MYLFGKIGNNGVKYKYTKYLFNLNHHPNKKFRILHSQSNSDEISSQVNRFHLLILETWKKGEKIGGGISVDRS